MSEGIITDPSASEESTPCETLPQTGPLAPTGNVRPVREFVHPSVRRQMKAQYRRTGEDFRVPLRVILERNQAAGWQGFSAPTTPRYVPVLAQRMPAVRSPAVRAPRPRGAGRPRAAATRSSAASGDSGDDGESSEPPGPRLCGCGCGADLSHRRSDAKFDKPACRKRAQRGRDGAHPELVAKRRVGDISLDDLPRPCLCDPAPTAVSFDPEDWAICVSCGRPCTVTVARVNGYDARLRKVEGYMRHEGAEPREVHRHKRSHPWRTRPRRGLSSTLRRTKRTYWVEGMAA